MENEFFLLLIYGGGYCLRHGGLPDEYVSGKGQMSIYTWAVEHG